MDPFFNMEPIGYHRDGRPIWPIKGGAEQVFNVAQLGRQAGTFYEPGTAVAGAVLYPVSENVNIDLDRASQYPVEDYGENWDAHSTRGSHGVRGATLSINSEARYQDLQEMLESHWEGDVAPLAGVWEYLLETGAPTLVPMTLRSGSEAAQDQWAARSVLIDELTLGFDDLDAPGHHPWTVDASCLAVDRELSALTVGVNAPATLSTIAGQHSRIHLGDVATAFAAITELEWHLISFQIVTRRHLVLRPYGSTADLALGYGFSAKSEGELTFKLRISASTKTLIHDAWNSSGAELGEIRGRVTTTDPGSSLSKILDFRTGLTAVPVGERDGERVYECTGKLIKDDTLGAPAKITLDNGVTALASAAGGS